MAIRRPIWPQKGGSVLGSLIIVAFGGVFMTMGVLLLKDSINAVNHMVRTNGTVVSLERHTGSKGSVSYAPVIKFTAEDGDIYTFTSSVSSNPPSHQPGDRVNVLYDPGNPNVGREDSFEALWLFPMLALVPGAAMLGFMAVLIVKRMQQAASE